MILIDFNPIAIHALTGINGKTNLNNPYETTNQLAQHLIYNKLRFLNKKFSKKYGEIVICLEGEENWKIDEFSLYKWKRHQDKKDSSYIDWNLLYKVMEDTITYIKKFFPYTVLRMYKCEADDVIAVMSKYINEQHIIISGDKDFKQLHGLHNVTQYCSKKDAFITLDVSPQQFLLEHILTGDFSDGIPNILSPDDTFVTGTRQKDIRQKYKDEFVGRLRRKELTEDELKNWKRNEKLISFGAIPKEIKLGILDLYNSYEIVGDHNTLLNYLIENKYTGLIGSIDEF